MSRGETSRGGRKRAQGRRRSRGRRHPRRHRGEVTGGAAGEGGPLLPPWVIG
ncbi:hypothetical protein ACFFX0_04500 [Citricoccus parietis]|uniref:Uncharacterized protein n=1 Tax=Citricoccus parietis TaxID=592307 RepID=A0ABV5FUX3_9MICC